MLTQVADGVFTHQSELLRNNTVVVQGTSGVLVIDAGITASEMNCLADDLGERGQLVVAGFSTHPDWDHVLWHTVLGVATRYSTARCAAAMRDLRAHVDWRESVTEGLPPEIVGDVPLDGFGLITALPAGADHVPWGGPRVRVIEHPAHSPGHAALVIDEYGVLVAGDMLSDVFVPMLDEADGTNDPISDYLIGLRRLEDAADDMKVVVPGHGSAGSGGQLRERIALDRAYVEALRDGGDVEDPRIGTSAKPGWEWVSDIHAGQIDAFAPRFPGPA